MSTLEQIAKDELLGRLTHAQAEAARACATRNADAVPLVLPWQTPEQMSERARAFTVAGTWRPAKPGDTPGQMLPEAVTNQDLAPPTGAVNGLQQADRSTEKPAEQGRAPQAPTCPWCLEAGCDGGASRCEEYENRIDLEHQAIRAPEIRIRIAEGGEHDA